MRREFEAGTLLYRLPRRLAPRFFGGLILRLRHERAWPIELHRMVRVLAEQRQDNSCQAITTSTDRHGWSACFVDFQTVAVAKDRMVSLRMTIALWVFAKD